MSQKDENKGLVDLIVTATHPAAARVASLPESPGVYLMKDKEGKIIYIGKAKSLRDRVRSYFNFQDTRAQIAFLLDRLILIDVIVTENEEQAFVLESDLIKRYQPRYNIRLKDDKAYLSVRINYGEEWPRIDLVRRIENDQAKYFGPYTSGTELRAILELIKTVVPLRTCSNTVFYNRQRPCLEYEIKRCAGPCCLSVDPDEYKGWLKQAERILQGKAGDVLAEIETKMEVASAELRFEEAALYRDRLNVLENFRSSKDIISYNGENRDVVGFFREGCLAAVSILHVREGRIVKSRNYPLEDVVGEDEEIIESVVREYYENGDGVAEILLPIELTNAQLLVEHFAKSKNFKPEIITAKKGIKRRLLGIAELNARQAFSEKFNAEDRYGSTAQELSRRIGLSQVPRRIECIDISNLQSTNIVGAVVAFQDGYPDKSGYRKYKVSFSDKPDDFKAMYEVVLRRLVSGIEDENLPDLLIIDGGKGQLNAALKARDEIGYNIEIVALAKKRMIEDKEIDSGQRGDQVKPERIFVPGSEDPILLPISDPVTHLLERIRDEAHRFVITFHRTQRARRVFASVLDGIAGLGEVRRTRLLKEFGSVDVMRNFTPVEIARRARIPVTLAEVILKRLE